MQGIALLVLLALTPHWVRVKDAYRVHERYVIRQHDGSQLMLGEFYEVAPGDIRAQCSVVTAFGVGGRVYSEDSAEAARSFVVNACTLD